MTRIRGAFGGGGQQYSSAVRVPREAKDNLESTSFARVLDLLGEGEIEGFPSARNYKIGSDEYENAILKDIFLDDTPILNSTADDKNPSDSDFNFKNVTVDVRRGIQGQSPIKGFDKIARETAVQVQVTHAVPITRTITDPTVTSVRITISIPLLQKVENNGDVNGSFVSLAIQIAYAGEGYTTPIADLIKGRTADLYQRDYVINLRETGKFPINIRVVRGTEDPTSSRVVNAFTWSSYTEIIDQRFSYPNTALVGMRVDSQQFSAIPRRSYRVRGIKVKVPSNATVNRDNGSLRYAGVWNGTFAAAQWCSDPAWILYDLLIATRYGLGDHIKEAQLDRYAFFEISKYCGEPVNTGKKDAQGNAIYEPRFSCNVNIQTQDEAYKLINDLCSTFRGMAYWSNGSITLSQDAPKDTAALFGLANVSEEGFAYNGSSLKTRPTVAIVQYQNLETRQPAYQVIEDRAALNRYGYQPTEVNAFGCTSPSQAQRVGEWLLYSGQYESETVSFTTNLAEGTIVRPGDIIEIADPIRSGERRAGRIQAVNQAFTQVTIDDATNSTLPTSGNPRLMVMLNNGTIEEQDITSIANKVVTVSTAFSASPLVGGMWVWKTGDLQTSTWRVLSVAEQDGVNYQVTALAYNGSKYAYIERDIPLKFRDVTNLQVRPSDPSNLKATELFYESSGRARVKIAVSWRAVAGVSQYILRWRESNGNWHKQTTNSTDYEIFDTQPVEYDVEVYAVGALGQRSNAAVVTLQAIGKTAAPAMPTGVRLVAIDQATAIFSWKISKELDVKIGGKVLIRHDPATSNVVWENANPIVPSAAGNQTQKQVPLLPGTYLVKFEDDGGRRSANAAQVVLPQIKPQPRLPLTFP